MPTDETTLADRVREAREHELKVWPQDFAALADGRKTFEWRQDDRGFAEGDTLWLREWSPGNAHRGEEAGYSGRELRRTISYILRARFGMPEHYVVLALAPDERARPRIPAALLRQYEHAAEKAESVGALKMLHKAEAAIGRWYLKSLRAADNPNEEKH